MLNDDNIQVLTAGFRDWVVKEDNGHYFHRPEGEYGEWHPGAPPDSLEADIEWAFRN